MHIEEKIGRIEVRMINVEEGLKEVREEVKNLLSELIKKIGFAGD